MRIWRYDVTDIWRYDVTDMHVCVLTGSTLRKGRESCTVRATQLIGFVSRTKHQLSALTIVLVIRRDERCGYVTK